MGIYFHIHCPVAPHLIEYSMFMFHNGTLRDNLNFKRICGIKQKLHFTKIAFDQSYEMAVHISEQTPWIGSMYMEEHWFFKLSYSLMKGGHYTQIAWDWEIMKSFFIAYNSYPIWYQNSVRWPFLMDGSPVDIIKHVYIPTGIVHPKIHVAMPVAYVPKYIWSRYPLRKGSILGLGDFNFDLPSTILFFGCLLLGPLLLKIFTFLGSKLGLPVVSEEPVLMPIR